MIVNISYKGLAEKTMRCITCKGRGLCGRSVCPILSRLEQISKLPEIKERIEGMSPPEVFVGRYGYPLVRAGPVVPAGNSQSLPTLEMGIEEIIASRTSMVRSEAKIEIKEAEAPGKLLEACQQIAMSSAPVGTEVSFFKPPQKRLQFDGILSPSGPSGELKDMEITTNPLIPRKVDRIVEDGDASAATALGELYSSGIGMDHISRMLSLGLLGKKRKLVPTRWSITASDDMIGKALKGSILDNSLANDYYLFSGDELGNHFEILLLPRPFSFELIEIWMPRSVWAEEGFIGTDMEDAQPKKDYSSLAGGYYAARLAVLEHLAGQGRQAAVLAVREISESYWAPLGVWVVREAARKAMSSIPQRFGTLQEALGEVNRRIKTPSSKWQKTSKLLAEPIQKSLADFQDRF
jgi:DNA repair protein NreA